MSLERLRRLARDGDPEAARRLADEGERRGDLAVVIEAAAALDDASRLERLLVEAWLRGDPTRAAPLGRALGLVLPPRAIEGLEALFLDRNNLRSGDRAWFEREDFIEVLSELALEPTRRAVCRESLYGVPDSYRSWLVALRRDGRLGLSICFAMTADDAVDRAADDERHFSFDFDGSRSQGPFSAVNHIAVEATAPAFTTTRAALRRGRLRHLLEQEPDPLRFRTFLDQLRSWPDDERDRLDDALHEAATLLACWPDAARETPPRWADEVALGLSRPGWHLVRHLRLPWRGFRPDDTGVPEPEALARFCASPHLAPIRQVTAASLLGEVLCRVLDGEHLGGIEALSLDDVALSPAEYESLAAGRHAASLRTLRIGRRIQPKVVHGRTDPTAPAMRTLLAGCTALRSLTLSGLASANEILFDNPVLQRVRELELRGATLGIIALRGLLGGLTALDALTIADNGRPLGAVMIRALVEAPALQPVRTLRVIGDGPGAEGVEEFARNPLQNLIDLDLGSWQMGDGGAQVLAGCGVLGRLQSLALADNGLTEVGARALSGALGRAPLRRLDLSHNRLGVRGLRALLAALASAPLRDLALSGNRLGVAGAQALVGWPGFSGLRRLELVGCSLGEGGRDALVAARPYGMRLELDTQ